MSPPAGQAPAQEEPIRPVAVSGSDLPHIPRKWVRDAIRVCLDLGYVVSGAEAWGLIKEYRTWQRADARKFIADEFRTYVQRRGDLLITRSKPKHAWRTSS